MQKPSYTKAYKITVWFQDGTKRSGYRFLPEGKVTAMKALRPIIESQDDFYYVTGYKIEDEKELGCTFPTEEVKHIHLDGVT